MYDSLLAGLLSTHTIVALNPGKRPLSLVRKVTRTLPIKNAIKIGINIDNPRLASKSLTLQKSGATIEIMQTVGLYLE